MVIGQGKRVSGLKRGDLGWIQGKFFYAECGEALEHDAQRCGGYPVPGDVQGQAGQALSNLTELWLLLLTAGELD